MTCSVYFERHAVAVPFKLLNDGSLAAQPISPAAAITGSPPDAVVVVVGDVLVLDDVAVVGDVLVLDDVAVVGDVLVLDDVAVVVVVVVVVADRISCGGVVV